MSDMKKTSLVLVVAPLPPDFEGSPQELSDAIIERAEIQSPSDTVSFVIGDIEPSTNQGPWLKSGKSWYVWDEQAGGYVPEDLTDATKALFTISATEPDEPGVGDAQIWLRAISGRVIAWYFWSGAEWRPGGNAPPNGPTASRPSDATSFEQYFDTDINVLLHWERGAWRTVSGSPGDVKFVTTPKLSDALKVNPGWKYIGTDNQSIIGRTLGIAAKDTGGSPESSFATDSGITARAATDNFGEEKHVITSTEIESHTHLIGALTALNSDNNAEFYRVDNLTSIPTPAVVPPNYARVNGDNVPNGTESGELPVPPAGTQLVSSRQLTLADQPAYTGAATGHNTVQPTAYLWCLTKQ